MDNNSFMEPGVYEITKQGKPWRKITVEDSTISEPPKVGRPKILAYLAAYNHNTGKSFSNWGRMHTSNIPWECFDWLIYFALTINKQGLPAKSLDPEQRQNFNEERLYTIVQEAHEQGKEILFSVGGSNNADIFTAISSEPTRSQTVQTLSGIMNKYGFDGIDVDLEHSSNIKLEHYGPFIRELRETIGPVKLLTTAINGNISVFSGLQANFDYINYMTYDMSGPWPGWQAWHNSPLYSSDNFKSTGNPLPSTDMKIKQMLNGGLSSHKTGFGIDLYGYVWNEVNLLDDFPSDIVVDGQWTGGIANSKLYNAYDLLTYENHKEAGAVYKNMNIPNKFISFENNISTAAKLDYAIASNLGSIIIWELGGGWYDQGIDPALKPLKEYLNS